jgi:hypothetical protein
MPAGFSLFPQLTTPASKNSKPIQRIMGISVLLLFTLFFSYIAAMVAGLIGKIGFGIDDADLIKRMISTPGHSADNINFLRWVNVFQSIISLGIPAVVVTFLVGWNINAVGNYKSIANKSQFSLGLLIAASLTPIVALINQGSEWIFNKLFPLSVLQMFQSLNANRQQIIEATLDMETLGELGVCLLILAMMPALLEEYLFRGLISKFASNHFAKSATVGIFQALVFSLIHFSPFEFFGIFIAGLILGSIRMHTQSLWLSTWVHFLFNATAICLHYYTLHHFNSTGIYVDTNQWFNGTSFLGIILFISSLGILIIALKKLYSSISTTEI